MKVEDPDWLTCKKCLLGGHGKARRTVTDSFKEKFFLRKRRRTGFLTYLLYTQRVFNVSVIVFIIIFSTYLKFFSLKLEFYTTTQVPIFNILLHVCMSMYAVVYGPLSSLLHLIKNLNKLKSE